MVSAAQNNLIQAALTPARVGSEVATAIAAKSLDAQRQEGAAAISLIDSAGMPGPSIPSGGDALTAKATGLGTLLDTTA